MASTPTWKFWQLPVVVPLAEQLRSRLVRERGLSEQAVTSLRMVNRQGRYADRPVTYFRVIDPEAVRRAGLELHRYADLDAHRPLQLHTGHIERDGQIVLNRS
jgi:erythromycin esterase-like protein